MPRSPEQPSKLRWQFALDFDAEHAGAFGADFVLMRYSGGAERHGEWAELNIAAAVFFRVVAAEEKAEERQFVRVRRKLAGLSVAEFGKDGSADLLPGERRFRRNCRRRAVVRYSKFAPMLPSAAST